MQRRTSIRLGILALLLGAGLAAFFYIALVEFALCCNRTSPPTPQQIQTEFRFFSLACTLTAYDFPEVVQRKSGRYLLITTVRRIYPGLALGQILIVAGLYLLLAPIMPQRLRRPLLWLAGLLILAVFVHAWWLCWTGPRGKILPASNNSTVQPGPQRQ